MELSKQAIIELMGISDQLSTAMSEMTLSKGKPDFAQKFGVMQGQVIVSTVKLCNLLIRESTRSTN